MSNNTPDYDYDYTEMTDLQSVTAHNKHMSTIRMLYITGYLIVCILGLLLNLSVITACCWKRCKTDTVKWVLALAATHLIVSAFLPLQILYSWRHFNWHYGAVLCKVSSYVFFASLFSTAGILSLWSVKPKSRLPDRDSMVVQVMILGSWTAAVILSIPSLYSRELRYTQLGQECIDDYDLDDDATTAEGNRKHKMVVLFRFIFGILIPVFLLIFPRFCRCLQKDKKFSRIPFLIKMAHIVCWTPLLFMGILQAFIAFTGKPYALPVATLLATTHCCVNPIIYLVVRCDFKMQWMQKEIY